MYNYINYYQICH